MTKSVTEETYTPLMQSMIDDTKEKLPMWVMQSIFLPQSERSIYSQICIDNTKTEYKKEVAVKNKEVTAIRLYLALKQASIHFNYDYEFEKLEKSDDEFIGEIKLVAQQTGTDYHILMTNLYTEAISAFGIGIDAGLLRLYGTNR